MGCQKEETGRPPVHNLFSVFTTMLSFALFTLFATFHACAPYSQEACELAAVRNGLSKGGNGYAFAGDYGTKGCYTYSSGSYKGIVFYGTGGSSAQNKADVSGGKYRPQGSDKCPHAASLASYLHGSQVNYEYQGAGCLNKPYSKMGRQTTNDCARLCEMDQWCKMFSMADGTCWTSSTSGYTSCGWFSSDEDIYTLSDRSAAAQSISMVTPNKNLELPVYGFAAIGLFSLLYGSYKFYCGGSKSQTTAFEEI